MLFDSISSASVDAELVGITPTIKEEERFCTFLSILSSLQLDDTLDLWYDMILVLG